MSSLRALLPLTSLRAAPAVRGRVVGVRGPLLLARIPQTQIGEICEIERPSENPLMAQVVSFEGDLIHLAALEELTGISPGAVVQRVEDRLRINIDDSLLGKVLDARGVPLDGSSSTQCGCRIPIHTLPPAALSRPLITHVFETGVSSIDTFCTLGVGQRVGLFAGAGVGKSTLLGMLARSSSADVTVIALIGERGREVNEFLQHALGPQGRARSIVVVSTSDQSPALRYSAALTATAIAEYFRDAGKHVLLLVDSLTRAARALRDMSLAAGELPVRQGYTPSVYAALPQLVERAGTSARGAITALYTVLTEGEQHDAIAEEIKSLLDGHLVLSNTIAQQGVRPAIDIPASLSRLSDTLTAPAQRQHVRELRCALQRLAKDKDLLLFGGTPDDALQRALQIEPQLRCFLNQSQNEVRRYSDSVSQLKALATSLAACEEERV